VWEENEGTTKNKTSKNRNNRKHSRFTFEGIGNLITFRHHIAKPVNLQGSFSTHTVGNVRVEEQRAFEIEAERRKAMSRTYSNMMPPR